MSGSLAGGEWEMSNIYARGVAGVYQESGGRVSEGGGERWLVGERFGREALFIYGSVHDCHKALNK